MQLHFTKMEGLGNDYVYVNCLRERVENPERLAVRISDRHFGVGADGLILIRASGHADFMMDMYNADGFRSEMCGNGIRCVGKYVYDYGLTDKESISIETLAGIKRLKLDIDRKNADDRGTVCQVTVDMGAPVLKPADIPVVISDMQDMMRDYPIKIEETEYRITCVSMGNPHCVTFVEDVDKVPLELIGPKLEYDAMFPNRVNAEFVQLVDRACIRMRVWERGTGETLACGTGACAAVVACVLNGLTEDAVTVVLRGGKLLVQWDREKNLVYMTGPATVVFDGVMEV